MRAYVLMTAMPPTKGHLRLVQFAASLAPEVVVILATQPGEPYINERLSAMRAAVPSNVTVNHLHRQLPQDPTAAAQFWPMWASFLDLYGIQAGDLLVASEPYGAKVAEITGATFMPFDIGRELYYSRATDVRREPLRNFNQILPEFQPYLRTTITLFGAESTGKTTLSKYLQQWIGGAWFFEYARPYLEAVGTEITADTMKNIWEGQRALQEFAQGTTVDEPFIIQDTDLFSTVGYYELWDGKVPPGIVVDAQASKSDIYLITPSNIPFEVDPIRYGGDKRESDDQFWIDLAKREGLNYHVLESTDREDRMLEALAIVGDFIHANRGIAYEREGQ